MRTTIRKRPGAGVVALAAAALTATVLTHPAQASGDAPAAAAGHQATKRAMDAAVAAGVPGVTAEAGDADGVWKSASGVGDLTTGVPRGENDRFRVGSITNTFVAVVLLQMEAEKKLSLDDTVERHLPGLVTGNGNDGSRITVRQLLNHTSGLTDYFSDPQYLDTYVLGDGFLRHRYDTLPPGARLRVAFSHAPQFEPGARHSFSHTNDILAALIVEKAGGRSYEEEVRERIVAPLKLEATSHPGTDFGLPRPSGREHARLFLSQPDRIDDVTEVNGSQFWGDSDIISSTRDLNRFYAALLKGKLLPPRQLAKMKSTVANPEAPGSSYGLGIERLTLGCGTTLWYHDGGTMGSISLVAMTEDGRHRLAFNYNGTWAAETILPILDAEFCEAPARSR